MATETKRPGGRTARNSDRIREAVFEILRTSGYSALSFQAVAALADVNRTTLYRRWDSKAEMAFDVIRETIRQEVIFEDTGSFESDARAALQQIGALLVGPLGSTLIHAGLEMSESPTLKAAIETQWSRRLPDLLPMFDRAIKRGELPIDVDSEAAFAMLAGALYFRVLVMSQQPDDAWINRVLKSFMANYAP